MVLLLASFQNINAQIVKDGNNVKMGVEQYRALRKRYYLCDTIIAKKDSIIFRQDSSLSTKNLKIESLQRELSYKDTTIKNLDTLFKSELKSSKKSNTSGIFIGGSIGFSIGFLFAFLLIK